MQVVHYNPNNDIGYIWGKALGNALGAMYSDHEARGAYKQADSDLANQDINKQKKMIGFLQSNMGDFKDPTVNAYNMAQLNSLGYTGPAITTQEQWQNALANAQKHLDYSQGFFAQNQGKTVGGNGGYTGYSTYLANGGY